MEILGYIASIFIGIALGLIGGGGSILTVPVLVYLFGESATEATGYSLFIVGLTALIGSFAYMKKKQVDFRTALVFGIPSIIAVFLTRMFLVPALSSKLFSLGNFDVTKDKGILFLFAGLMVASAYGMIRKKKGEPEDESPPTQVEYQYGKILIEGLVIGTLTGLVGAGGGFLIIPALVLLAKVPMKTAVGTSLLIIAAKSLIGFGGDLIENPQVDWGFLLTISAIAVVGIMVGSFLSRFISGAKLKPAFGIFVLVMGVYMIGKEVVTPPPVDGGVRAETGH